MKLEKPCATATELETFVLAVPFQCFLSLFVFAVLSQKNDIIAPLVWSCAFIANLMNMVNKQKLVKILNS